MKFKEFNSCYESEDKKISTAVYGQKMPKMSIEFYGGSKVNTFDDIVSYEKNFRNALRKFSISENINGNTYGDLMKTSPLQQNINGEWPSSQILAEFFKSKNAVLMCFGIVEKYVWNGTSFKFSPIMLRVNGINYKITSKLSAKEFEFSEPLSRFDIIASVTATPFNAYEFYKSVLQIGYTKSKEMKNMIGDSIFGNIHNWIVFK